MAGDQAQKGNDKGIGEGNLREEPGAPPYADRQYADEQEPVNVSPSQTGTAGGTNVSAQGGGSGSSKQGGNSGGTKDASG